MTPDNFTVVPFNFDNLDRYYVRTSIKRALDQNLNNLSGVLLDIGCGKMPYRDYILSNSEVNKYVGLDIETALTYDESIKPNFTWNGITMPFDDDTFDSAFGTELLEHCPVPEIVMKEAFRILKPGGTFFFTVPFLWPLHEVPHDEYRYTPWSLKRHLENSGFSDVQISPLGGWHAAMAQMLGLWIKRSPLSGRSKKNLAFVLSPFIKKLIRMDSTSKVSFSEGQMITGLYGIARKK